MNIEIANRLVNLRKSNNLSQEALAEKLGISRQAVSKWERAEASPDTDNLILLARLYQISLDELLKTEDEIPIPEPESGVTEFALTEYAISGQDPSGTENARDGQEVETANSTQEDTRMDVRTEVQTDARTDPSDEEDAEYVHVGLGGVHVKDKNGEVHVGWDGIHVDDKGKGDNVHIDKNGVYVNGEKYNGREAFFSHFPIDTLIIIVYLLIGCLYGAWHPGWLLFFLIPIWHSLVTAVRKRSAYCFAYPILVTLIYLCLGFFGFLWHPGWVIFLTIPFYYSAASWINSWIRGYGRRDGGLDEEE